MRLYAVRALFFFPGLTSGHRGQKLPGVGGRPLHFDPFNPSTVEHRNGGSLNDYDQSAGRVPVLSFRSAGGSFRGYCGGYDCRHSPGVQLPPPDVSLQGAVFPESRDGIEHSSLHFAPSPAELYEEKEEIEALYAALAALPEKQGRRVFAHYILGVSKAELAPSGTAFAGA